VARGCAQSTRRAPAAWPRRRLPRAPWRGRATAASAARGLPTQLVCQLRDAPRNASPARRKPPPRTPRRAAQLPPHRSGPGVRVRGSAAAPGHAVRRPPAAIHRPVPRHGRSKRHQLFRAVRPGYV
jgi:hypothetical protein